MPKGALPGYVWDNARASYRRVLPSGALGSYVTRDEIVAGLRQIAAASEKMLGDLAMAVARGELTTNDGILAGAQLLKDLYNANSALARGGWSQMNAAAWGRNGHILGLGTREYPIGEYASWRGFVREIATGNLSEAQIRDRARLYIGKAYSRFFAEDRLLKLQDSSLTWESWLDTGGENECSDCLALAALGRVPLGTLRTVPGAGATRCLGNCRCVIIYG